MARTALMHRLITIRFSHYAERARWALDRAGIAYAEQPHLPLFHFPAVLRATRGTRGRADKASTGYSTPILVTAGGQLLRDSKHIVQFACSESGEDLYPHADVSEMEQRLHDRLGPHGRRVAYFSLFENPSLLPVLAKRNVPRLEASAFTAALPLVRKSMMRLLDVNRETAERSSRIAREEFAWVGSILGDKPYLLGDVFSAADLTFAAMAASVILPSAKEGYGANLFGRDELPDTVREQVDELRDTIAGRHALRMFATERGSRIVQCSPPLDTTAGY